MGLADRLALAGAKIRTSNDFRNDTVATTSADSKRERRKPPTTTAATGATGARSPFSPNSAFCYTSLNSAKRAGEVAVSRYEAPHTHSNQTRKFFQVWCDLKCGKDHAGNFGENVPSILSSTS